MNNSGYSVTHNRYENLQPEDIDKRQFTGDVPEQEYYKLGQRHAKQVLDGYAARRSGTPDTIIDYGCGDGRVARYVATVCAKIICADISGPVLDMAAKKMKRFKVKNAEFVNIAELTGKNADFIYSLQVMQHNTYEDQLKIAEQINSLLKPGALACIHFPKLEDKPWYKNSDTCMCFTRGQVESIGALFHSYEVEECEFAPGWIDYYLWVTKEGSCDK